MRPVAAIVALFGAAVISSSAQAAVSVFGNGVARTCYLYADHGIDSYEGERICTAALALPTLMGRDLAATYINRGVVRSNLGRYQGALDDYNHAIDLQHLLPGPDLGVAYVDRCSVLNAMGRYDEALASVNKGLSLGATRPEIAYYNRAIAEEALGNIKGAYLDYKQALALVPDFTPASEQLKRFHVEVKQSGGS